jgi:uncharacterized protein (DUF2252 family)
MDAVQLIAQHNAGREPERLWLKYSAMRQSAFAFLRGSCHLFYQRLPRGGVFRSAPAAWICGDLHLENFGSYKGDNRLVYFDLNDFDEAALAPLTWELVRMLCSIRVAARDARVEEGDVQQLCRTFVDAHAQALAGGKAFWIERETAQGLVRELLDGLRGRQRVDLLASRTRTVGRKRQLLVDGIKALPATPAQRHAVASFMQGFAPSQPDPSFYEVLDVARRIAGTGSLGLPRYIVLVRGKGSPDRNYLLDLKLAQASSLTPRLRLAQPVWATQAHRVVELQRRMQAVPMAFSQPVVFDGRPFVIKGLQPSQDRVALLERHRTLAQWQHTLAAMGRLVAWAQLRSAARQGSAGPEELIDFARRRKWRDALLDASADCTRCVLADAASFNQAWDDGALGAAASAGDARH